MGARGMGRGGRDTGDTTAEGREGGPSPCSLLLHLELVPGVGMEAMPAASQVQAGVTQGLLGASPANEAAAVIVPRRRCFCVTEPPGVPCIVGGGGEERPGGEGSQVPWPEVLLVLLTAGVWRDSAGDPSAGWSSPETP